MEVGVGLHVWTVHFINGNGRQTMILSPRWTEVDGGRRQPVHLGGGRVDRWTKVRPREACLKQIANYAFTRTKYQSFGVITNFYFKPEQHMICYISFNQLKFERKVYLYRGVTHQSETFGFKLTHIRVKHLVLS